MRNSISNISKKPAKYNGLKHITYKLTKLFVVLLIVVGFCFINARFARAEDPPQPTTIERLGRGNIGHTGDMTLDIPLMTVPGRNGLNFPLVLHYRAGITVDQDASWVGLGFGLDTGNVQRSPVSTPDYYPFSYPETNSLYGASVKDHFFVSTPQGSFPFINQGTPAYPSFLPSSWSAQKLRVPIKTKQVEEYYGTNYYGWYYQT